MTHNEFVEKMQEITKGYTGKQLDDLYKSVELVVKVDEVTKEFHGQLDHLYEAVGMMMLGRLMGYRVMRLVSSKRCWRMAINLFGDHKKWMDEKGKYYDKSIGMKVFDTVQEYWDFIAGNVNRDDLPLHKRKLID
jgi:hypothetical protein